MAELTLAFCRPAISGPTCAPGARWPLPQSVVPRAPQESSPGHRGAELSVAGRPRQSRIGRRSPPPGKPSKRQRCLISPCIDLHWMPAKIGFSANSHGRSAYEGGVWRPTRSSGFSQNVCFPLRPHQRRGVTGCNGTLIEIPISQQCRRLLAAIGRERNAYHRALIFHRRNTARD